MHTELCPSPTQFDRPRADLQPKAFKYIVIAQIVEARGQGGRSVEQKVLRVGQAEAAQLSNGLLMGSGVRYRSKRGLRERASCYKGSCAVALSPPAQESLICTVVCFALRASY